jgi:hypothetical protein
MLKIILENGDKSKILMENFFNNSFNEPVHARYQGLFEQIQTLLRFSYSEYKCHFDEYNRKINESSITEEEKAELALNPVHEAIEQTYAALRFIHFINLQSNE